MTEHQSLSVADLKDIQAGPVVPIPTRSTIFLFFAIKDVNKFRDLFGAHVLPLITTSDSARRMREEVFRAKLKSELATLAGINVSFSQRGLTMLLGNADTKDDAFKEGQWNRAQALGDDREKWLNEFRDNSIHGLFEVSGYPATHVQDIVQEKIKNPLSDTAITVIYEHSGKVRPDEQRTHEHFGFNDGISQPYVKFEDDGEQKPTERKPFPGQIVVNPGVLVLGQPGDESTRPSWTKNGAFVVYRHLKQLVPEFRTFLEQTVRQSIIINPSLPSLKDSEDFQKRVDFLGARLMGRWKSGMPVVLTPMPPDGTFPVDDSCIGKNRELNNNFDYGTRGEQFLCPFAAHTRKTGPRTDLPLKPVEQHMIHRGGITYGCELSDEEKSGPKTIFERGLSFVCYQSSLIAGFEFIQKSWSNNETFPPQTPANVVPGFDPIIGQKQGQPRKMTGHDAENLSKELNIPMQFVIAQGGEYFFLPSITTLEKISSTIAL
ncbi:Dyp-type peroxidase [Phlegmacium glaucopus]|nr:Dyp-type peroxidase [Phlegmacium glaucopus]